jgi:hypothetical protein
VDIAQLCHFERPVEAAHLHPHPLQLQRIGLVQRPGGQGNSAAAYGRETPEQQLASGEHTGEVFRRADIDPA